MSASAALPCPKCRRVLETPAWIGADAGCCPACQTDFDFIPLPALQAERRRAVPKAVLVAEQATCFFHAENEAETVCDGCGRFLCTVCALDFSGRTLCPNCVAAAGREQQAVTSCMRYDSLALALVILPLLVWPATLVAAPLALGVVIYGWRKPRSLVRPGRAKFMVAGLIALVQIAVWVAVIATAVELALRSE